MIFELSLQPVAEDYLMRGIAFGIAGIVAIAAVSGIALAAQNKDTVEVPGGLALYECSGYEEWAAVSVSRPEDPEKLNLIVANPEMIAAYLAGVPGNGEPFPDGAAARFLRKLAANRVLFL